MLQREGSLRSAPSNESCSPTRPGRRSGLLTADHRADGGSAGSMTYWHATVFTVWLIRLDTETSAFITNWSHVKSPELKLWINPAGVQRKVHLFFFFFYKITWSVCFCHVSALGPHSGTDFLKFFYFFQIPFIFVSLKMEKWSDGNERRSDGAPNFEEQLRHRMKRQARVVYFFFFFFILI